MSFIDKNFIHSLVQNVDIVDYIGRFVKLKEQHNRGVGLCPFHNEKTPSFNVSRDFKTYHCFGCKESGNIIGFAMQYHNLGFVEAVENIAASFGYEVVYSDKKVNNNELNYMTDLKRLINDQAEWFMKLLRSNEGEKGRSYLATRSLNLTNPQTSATLDFFKVGYYPFSAKQYKENLEQLQQLKDIDILREKDDGKITEPFIGRIMFPILNVKGEVVGFGGRSLDSRPPKYINSSNNSKLYDKSKELYGLFQAIEVHRQNRIPVNSLVLVEGYLDVISLYHNGLPIGVASSGTAIQETQLNILFKRCSYLFCCFDSDKAGQKAAFNVALLTIKLDKSCRFMSLPQGEDPDSFVTKYGKEQFKALMRQAISTASFVNNYILEQLHAQEFGFDENEYLNKVVDIIVDLESTNSYVTVLVGLIQKQINCDLELLRANIQSRQEYKNNLQAVNNREQDRLKTNFNRPSNKPREQSFNSQKQDYLGNPVMHYPNHTSNLNRNNANNEFLSGTSSIATSYLVQSADGKYIPNKEKLSNRALTVIFKAIILNRLFHNNIFNPTVELLFKVDALTANNGYLETINHIKEQLLKIGINRTNNLESWLETEKEGAISSIFQNKLTPELAAVINNNAIELIEDQAIFDNNIKSLVARLPEIITALSNDVNKIPQTSRLILQKKTIQPLIELKNQLDKLKKI